MIFPYYDWVVEYYRSIFNENVILWETIMTIKYKVEKNNKKSKEIRIKEIKAVKILNHDIELNKEKFNNLDWIEYNNFNIPERDAKLTFIKKIKEINKYHNFILKNLLKRNIYKKYGLDDYQIHKDIIHYFDSMKYDVDSLLFTPFGLKYLCYYNGNKENYEKNVNTYLNILNDLKYTDYYLNEADRREKEEELKKQEIERKNQEIENNKTKEQRDKEMWEYKREGEKMKYYSKEYYKNIMNTGVRNTGVKNKYDITDSINSLGNFFN